MKYLLFFLTSVTMLFDVNNTLAQLTKQTVTGTWVCKEASTPLPDPGDPEMKESVEALKKGFLSAHFIFRPDGIFNLQLPPNTPAMMEDLEFLDNRRWFMDEKQKVIFIGTREENLMQIKVRQEGSFLWFSLHETPLSLKMEKQ